MPIVRTTKLTAKISAQPIAEFNMTKEEFDEKLNEQFAAGERNGRRAIIGQIMILAKDQFGLGNDDLANQLRMMARDFSLELE